MLRQVLLEGRDIGPQCRTRGKAHRFFGGLEQVHSACSQLLGEII